MEPVFDEIKAWLNKANSDLFAAQILVEHSSLALGPAAFHCQQTAEKAFKFIPCELHPSIPQDSSV